MNKKNKASSVKTPKILKENKFSLLAIEVVKKLKQSGIDDIQIQKLDEEEHQNTKPNWLILGGSLVFVIFTLGVGTLKVPFAQEIVFLGSMLIILF